jgi:hypothetical protein
VPQIVRKMKTIYDHTLRRVAPIHSLVRASVWTSSSLLLSLASRVTRLELPRDDEIAPYFRFPVILGQYQKEVVALSRSLLRPGMIVVDVGAHVGYHTVRLRSSCSTDWKGHRLRAFARYVFRPEAECHAAQIIERDTRAESCN